MTFGIPARAKRTLPRLAVECALEMASERAYWREAAATGCPAYARLAHDAWLRSLALEAQLQMQRGGR